jgi:enoyl-CoA hydratase/carnithine racemase
VTAPLVSVRTSELDTRVAVVSLDRVAGHNALSSALCCQLTHHLAAVADDDRYRAVVLTSSAAHFSVGADLKERAQLSEADLLEARQISIGLTQTVLHCRLPVVAAVHGFTLGGGMELALACDLIVASPTAVFGLPESGVGIIPGGGGTQLLARRVGWGAAVEMVLTGRQVLAEEACDRGLVDRPLEAEPVAESGTRVAAEIASRNPQSVRLIREVMRAGSGLGLDAALELEGAAWRQAALSEDYREGLASFVHKRSPAWEHPTPSI